MKSESKILEDSLYLSSMTIVTFIVAILFFTLYINYSKVDYSFFIQSFTPLIFVLSFLAFIIFMFSWIISTDNDIKALLEEINKRKSNLKSSKNRKDKLVSDISIIADNLSSIDSNLYKSISKDISKSISDSNSVIIANLLSKYPQLKNDQLFTNVQAEIIKIENSIDIELRSLNDIITTYNKIISLFPTNIIASGNYVRLELES